MRRDTSFLVLLFVVGCSHAGSVATTALAPSGEPVAVTATQPERKSLTRNIDQPGTVLPSEETQLHAKVAGYIEVLSADIGKRVLAGEALAELAVPELVQEVKAKKALVKRAEAEADQARTALAATRATADVSTAVTAEMKAGLSRTEAARQRWASESERMTRLVQQGILDPQTRDETNNQYSAARAAHVEAQARVASALAQAVRAEADVEKGLADVAAAVARVEEAKAEAARVEALFKYARITAPYAGVVTRRRANTGDFVQPTAGKGDGIFAVAKLDPVRLVVQVPEADAGLVTESNPVLLHIPALKGPPITATVTRTAWSLEPGSRTLRVEIDHTNTDLRVRPGMYLQARLTQQLPEAWTLPASAVTKQGDDLVCFAIHGNKVVRTKVLTGHNDGKFIEIVRLGLVEPTGSEQIAASAAGLTDGASVTVR